MYIVDLGGEVYKVVPEPAVGMLRALVVLFALLGDRRRRLSRWRNARGPRLRELESDPAELF
jgi:hypothetical protein